MLTMVCLGKCEAAIALGCGHNKQSKTTKKRWPWVTVEPPCGRDAKANKLTRIQNKTWQSRIPLTEGCCEANADLLSPGLRANKETYLILKDLLHVSYEFNRYGFPQAALSTLLLVLVNLLIWQQ